ncbi:MAG: hypothetical protein ACYDCK_00485 [Thermoplasmatota archaeon]
MKRSIVFGLLVVLVAAPVLSGCLGFGGKKPVQTAGSGDQVKQLLGNNTGQQLEQRLSVTPSNYTMAGQLALPPVTRYYNDSIGPEDTASYQDANDRGGNSFNVEYKWADITPQLPAGQPAQIRVTLSYQGQPGSSAKCDPVVDVPGTKITFDPSNDDQWNWKFTTLRDMVDTIGVAGVKAQIGVGCADGMAANPLSFSLRMEFSYVKDVLTPYFPWAFNVPTNATGLILESEKAGGTQHISAWFSIIGPDDKLVQFVDFNDIGIPTQTVFIPVSQPGQYIFYAYNMTGGFMRLRADTGVENRAAVPLALKTTAVTLESSSSPGVVARDWGHGGYVAVIGSPIPTDNVVVTPDQGGEDKPFAVTGTFPLRIVPFIGDAQTSAGDTAMSEISIKSSKGIVASLQRVLRHDDAMGSVGYTQDYWNSEFVPKYLVQGSFNAHIVNDGPTEPVGYVLTTYAR